MEGLTSFALEQARAVVEARLQEKGGSGGSQKREEKREEGSGDDKDVVVLTDGTFESTLTGSSDLWIVEFYGTLPCPA